MALFHKKCVYNFIYISFQVEIKYNQILIQATQKYYEQSSNKIKAENKITATF